MTHIYSLSRILILQIITDKENHIYTTLIPNIHTIKYYESTLIPGYQFLD